MGHILFPRYIQRDARDFFYLTARHVLPGAPIEPGAEWRVKGLPQHGYPYASAITSVTLPAAGDRRVRVLRIDPRAVAVDGSSDGDESVRTVAVFARPARAKGATRDAGASARAPDDGEKKLWLGEHIFTIDEHPTPNAVALTSVVPPSSSSAANARGAVGISDEDGMLQWIELLPEDAPSAETSAAMLALLERIGCSSARPPRGRPPGLPRRDAGHRRRARARHRARAQAHAYALPGREAGLRVERRSSRSRCGSRSRPGA